MPILGSLPKDFSLSALINEMLGRGEIFKYSLYFEKKGDIVKINTKTTFQSTTTTTTDYTTNTKSPTTTNTVISTTTSTNIIPTTTTTTIKPSLSVMIIPLNWEGDYNSYIVSADKHANKFLNSVPLKNCPEKFKYLKADKSSDYGNGWDGWICKVSMPIPNCYIWYSALEEIRDCADQYKIKTGEDYDFVVGIGDSDIGVWDGSTCDRSIGGWSDGQGGEPSVVAEDSFSFITPHELGHEFGLNDEYCCNTKIPPNPITCSPGCCFTCGNPGTSQYCQNRLGTSKCSHGNLNSGGGRCIMSYVNAPGPREFCPQCLNHLSTQNALKC